MRHSKTNDRVNMQKRHGFLRTERDVKETKKKSSWMKDLLWSC